MPFYRGLGAGCACSRILIGPAPAPFPGSACLRPLGLGPGAVHRPPAGTDGLRDVERGVGVGAAGAATTADGDLIAVSGMDVLLFGTNWTSVQSTRASL